MYWWEDCFYTFFSHHLVKTILSPTVEGTFNLKAVNAEMTPEILQEVLLGCVVGLMVGLTGAGGAALAIPGMTLLLGVPAMTAVATAFPFTGFTKVFAFLEHRRLGTIHWPVAKYYLIGTIPGTLAGIITLSRLYDRLGSALDFWLKLAIGLLLILSVIISLFQRQPAAGLAPDPPSDLTLSQKFLAVGVSAVLGVIIGATSVGGGSFLVISILILFPIRTVRAVGTSIAVSLFLMIEGAMAYFGTGLMDIPLAVAMAGGAVPAAILGSRMAKRVPESILGITVSGAVLVAGGLLILRLFPRVP
jgi:uncharacterized protein